MHKCYGALNCIPIDSGRSFVSVNIIYNYDSRNLFRSVTGMVLSKDGKRSDH
jgi:hypothetical protein